MLSTLITAFCVILCFVCSGLNVIDDKVKAILWLIVGIDRLRDLIILGK